MSRVKLFLILALAVTLLAPLASAQVPFTIRSQQDGIITDIPDGGTVSIAAEAVGMAKSATMTITYTGVDPTEISAIERTGSQGFSINSAPPPFPLERGDSFLVTVTYLPGSSAETDGLITFTWLDPNAVIPPGGPAPPRPTFTVNLLGTAPEFAFTYLPPGGNTTQVQPGTTLSFPDTPVDTTTTGTLTVVNVGTAPGEVSSVTPTGLGFEVSGLPLLPIAVAADGELAIAINFTPQDLNPATGNVAIGLVGGAVNFPLAGVGSGPSFTYEVTVGGETGPTMPGATIRFPDTLLDDTNTALIRVRNAGNAEGTISSVTVSGLGFAVTNLPSLPARIPAGGEIVFTVDFTPTETGQAVGRLLVGDAEFAVAGNGAGALLAYHFAIGGVTNPVDDAGTVNFTPTTVGATSSATFLITNTGTTDSSINSISLEKAQSAFQLDSLPGLPVTIESGGTVSFQIDFAPDEVGSATDTLKLDNVAFTLAGRGNQPPPLPGFQFEGPSGELGPRAQPSVGVTLDSPYPLAVTGTLTLTFDSGAFSNDPAVQFANGSRTAAFTIPADSMQAVFGSGGTSVALQTGTVAGTITITPSFAAGQADLTPEDPLTQTMMVGPSAPVILSAGATQESVVNLSLEVTGFVTTRKVTQISLSFTPVAGESVSTTSLSLDVEGSFDAWFTDSQSRPFGSQFTATIPLSFSGNVNNAADPVATISAVSVTLANAQGTSGAVTIPLQ